VTFLSSLVPDQPIPNQQMAQPRPTRLAIATMVAGLALVAAAAVWRAASADWDLPLFFILLGFSVFSDLTAISTTSKVKISGSFLALVLAMVFLGGTPAAVIGVLSILAGWLRWRDAGHYLLNNVLTYATFPLLSGIAFHEIVDNAGIAQTDGSFYALIFAVFLLALAINFTMIASYSCYLDRSSFFVKVRTALFPLLPSELAAALMAVGVAYLYVQLGLAGVAMFGVVLVTFQYLLGALLVSQQRAEELELRSKQLASFQVGMLSAMLRTLDLRDQMTARHSAAVARYSRAIAQRAGYSRREEELVHIAALLHDIGKFILPDRILKANVPLTDEDWMLIKRHPQQGARVVSSLDGYGPVAEIILAHHERIDGKGYPRGLAGDEIPELARIISVADTYDVMTARDSYRTPMSSYDAIVELRRVAGKQLDARFVEIFIELLEGKDVSFQHGEAADFEKELALEARIEETASPGGEKSRFQVAGVN
jgi:putative nucleotidyltransferase with HDIG domain